MLNEALTTGSNQATFQWFRGTYTSFVPIYKATDPQKLERGVRPGFFPLEDGDYWARVDGRCGSAASNPIHLISCLPYSGFVSANAPSLPVAKDRPLVIAAKLISRSPVLAFDGVNYKWSNPAGAPFSSGGADKSSIIVTPAALFTVYHLVVSNSDDMIVFCPCFSLM